MTEAAGGVLGVDPGIGGALVLLVGGQPVDCLRMPTIQAGKRSRVNGAALAGFVGDCQAGFGLLDAVIEDVAARPGQGVSSMFSFGHAAGVAAGVLAACGVPVTYVTPSAWRRSAGIPSGADKDAARSAAVQLWPGWRVLDAKIAGQAYADAALIARWGARSAIVESITGERVAVA